MFNLRKKEKEEFQNREEIIEEIKKIRMELKETREELEKIKEEKRFFAKNISIERFNPFSERGGDQSFSFCILNDEGDGIVVTSIYTENSNRVYSKPIKKWKSEYSLSKEEEKVINSFIKKEK